jgi:hypothetical protein
MPMLIAEPATGSEAPGFVPESDRLRVRGFDWNLSPFLWAIDFPVSIVRFLKYRLNIVFRNDFKGNTGQMNKLKNIRNIENLPVFIMILLTIILGACAGKYARYKVSNDVETSFKSFRAQPDYVYYTDISGIKPGAIIAVHKTYELSNSDLWHKVDLSGDQLKALVTAMVDNAHITRPPYGYHILDPRGEVIGTIFTPLRAGPIILEENNQVAVGFPENDYGPSGGAGE